jgi:carotenoid cleavage dioxygenase
MTLADDTRSLPFHLRGNYAPVTEEITVTDLEVTGAIPPSLHGRYFRNGANPITGESDHWFLGNGMLHGVELQAGRATWYRNRYVRTPRWENPDQPLFQMSEDGTVDRVASLANTHIVAHAGRILALEEAHFPWEVDRTLDTVGVFDFAGKLRTPMTAHPKICPVTGELLFFGYDVLPPYLTYHRVNPAGELVQSEAIDVAGPTMVHDFNVTRNHVIFMDLPVVFDLELAMSGGMPFRWDENYGARLGVLPRTGVGRDIRWYEIEPCYVFHPMNAYEDGAGRLVLDVGRFPKLWGQTSEKFVEQANLHRWVIDPATGTVAESPIDDRPAEFARVADGVVGQRHRYGYMVGTSARDADPMGQAVIKYEVDTGKSWVHDFGRGRQPGEAVFVADPEGRDEDEGWLMTYVYDAATDRSELVIVDATDMAAAPVARVHLPKRVPFGFHGSWIPDA